jgi:dihydrofolate synthase/folylpolyglutamate synthase
VAVADATLDALESAGIARVPGEARRVGYAAVRWPGRMELVEASAPEAAPGSAGPARGREILLDGAHNPAGAAALAEALDDIAPFLRPGRPTLVLAIMADKDVDGVVRALAGSTLLRDARVICTAPAGGRALPADQLAARWRVLAGRTAEVVEEPAAAIDAALSSGSGTGPVIVAGSLYLVGAARAILVPDPLFGPDPLLGPDPPDPPDPPVVPAPHPEPVP